MLQGYATQEGTARFASRMQPDFAAGHFRETCGLHFSSIGLGSYLGESDDSTDLLYMEAARKALLEGINVLDAAINYRSQRSERSFGRILTQLVENGSVKRDEVIVCTKGGFLPFDGEYPQDPRMYFREKFVASGILKAEDISQGCHAMTPAFLENQLEQSRKNLNVETIDIYYVHNPETQLASLDRREFREKMRLVFRWMEEKVREGRIRMYGTATWSGYRVAETQPEYLSLEDLNLLAREEGGRDHHFRAVQLPFNFAMPEAWIFKNQMFGKQPVTILQSAARLEMAVMISATLLQSQLAGPLPDFLNQEFKGFEKSSQKAIQFVRSVPGVTSALVGMKQAAHVAENLATAGLEPFSEEKLISIFQKAPAPPGSA